MRPARTTVLLIAVALGLAGCSQASATVHDVKLGFALPGDSIDMTPDQDGKPMAVAFRAVAPTADLIRTDILWSDVQPGCRAIDSHRFRWKKTDEEIRLFLTQQVAPLLTLTTPPPCAAVKHNSSFQPKARYVPKFGTFAKKVVERYGPGGTYFDRHPELADACCAARFIEIWNEPNLPKKWSPADPQRFGRFFVRVAKRIRAADNFTPRVKVITGAVTGLNGGAWETNGRAFIRGLYEVRGLKHAASRIGIHTYSPTARQAMRNVRVVRHIMDEHGDSAPIQITEHGWSTCPEPGHPDSKGKCVTLAAQAKRMETLVTKLTAPRNGGLNVRSFLWFQAQDLATPESVADCRIAPKNFYGLWNHAGDPKPARDTWEELTGKTLPGSLPEANRLHGCTGRWS